jgi:hypothetical protein
MNTMKMNSVNKTPEKDNRNARQKVEIGPQEENSEAMPFMKAIR